MGQQPLGARASSLSRRYDHTQTHYNRKGFSGRGISPIQTPLPDDTQHWQDTDIYAPGWIRTRNPKNLAAEYPRFRPRRHRDRQEKEISPLTYMI
jgi:hypothetical protein